MTTQPKNPSDAENRKTESPENTLNDGILDLRHADEERQLGIFYKVTQVLFKWGIETHG